MKQLIFGVVNRLAVCFSLRGAGFFGDATDVALHGFTTGVAISRSVASVIVVVVVEVVKIL